MTQQWRSVFHGKRTCRLIDTYHPFEGTCLTLLPSRRRKQVTPTQHFMYRTSEISVHKILNYVRLAYLSRSAADEGLYFWCSVRRRWCCCGRPGFTSSLLIIVFCCRCPPPGQHTASSQHLPTHARAPHRVTIATGDEGPPILPNQAMFQKVRK